MVRVDYRGYIAVQHHNRHIAIYNKGGTMVYHAQMTVKLSEDELRAKVDEFIKTRETN